MEAMQGMRSFLKCLFVNPSLSGAINPARDFGPRIWASFFDGELAFTGDNDKDSNTFQGVNSEYFFWIPLAGPIAGGLIG